MPTLPKPEIILTHESDLDGFVAGCLLEQLSIKLFGEKPRMEAWNNSGWKLRPLHEPVGWVTDMAFDSRLDRKDWVVIDHHSTSREPQKATLIHDANRSAGAICYGLCRENGLELPELERLVHLNNVADLFLSDDEGFTEAMDYASLIKSYGFWNIYHLIEGDLKRLVNHPLLQVMKVRREVEDPIGYDYSRNHVTELSSAAGYVDTTVGNSNLIINRLLQEKVTSYPVLITLSRRGTGNVMVSLRSQNGEALPVAEQLGGGGHPNACGATLPKSVKGFPEAIEYLQHVLNKKPEISDSINPMGDLMKALEK